MRDQAAALRELRAEPAPRTLPRPAGPAAVVIGSGKGGVGKSVLSVLFAAELAREGRRVLLLDGAQNQGNLHILLGVRPTVRLGALLLEETPPEQLLLPVADRLWLLPADSGAEAVHTLTAVDRGRLHCRLSTLYDRFDAVVIDAGPGIDSVVRVGAVRATRLAVVAVPEPAALSDAYALIKIVHLQVPWLPVGVLVNRFLRREVAYLGAVPEDGSLRRAVRSPGELLQAPCAGAAAAIRGISAALVAAASPEAASGTVAG
jgi:flagellar biosynthesis protein FlhG